MIRGIDVSHHQGTVNWSILESAYGLSWGAAKAYEGLHTPDSQFAANWRGMKAAGLVRMAYYFAHPDNDGANGCPIGRIPSLPRRAESPLFTRVLVTSPIMRLGTLPSITPPGGSLVTHLRTTEIQSGRRQLPVILLRIIGARLPISGNSHSPLVIAMMRISRT